MSLTSLFAASRFLQQCVNRMPDWCSEQALVGPSMSALRLQALAAPQWPAADIEGLMRELRRIRNAEMARIVVADLYLQQPLDVILSDISQLAQGCCQLAVNWSHDRLCERHGVPRNRHGEPIRPIVLGMGKLGGGELNFSSDIDLIFCHTDAGETDGERVLDHAQFFARLVQWVTRLLAEITEDGFVFRVDTMLRPFGSAGPSSISVQAAEDYYTNHGREWERYALVKARPIAGDLVAGHRLLSRLRPFVYRRYLDFGAIDNLRRLKRLIEEDYQRRAPGDSIKLGAGGIRELEFIVQSFQLVRGGQEARLRDPRLRPVLAFLGSSGLLAPDIARELDDAYVWLRRVENAIQMYDDGQTHLLPREPASRAALCAALRFDDWDALMAALDPVRDRVHEVFLGVFAPQGGQLPQDATTAPACNWWQHEDPETLAAALSEQGLQGDLQSAVTALTDLRSQRLVRQMSDAASLQYRQLAGLLVRDLAKVMAAAHLPDRQDGEALRRIISVLGAIAGRSTYVALLLESPSAREQLVRLCAASPVLAGWMSSSPALLDCLLDVQHLYSPTARTELKLALEDRFRHIPASDVEAGMDALRRFRQETMLRIAAADISGQLPLVQVSDHLTWLAEVVLDMALSRAREELVPQFGDALRSDGSVAAFVAIAYGKFGGLELGYGSDLDLVFIHDAEPVDAETAGGTRQVSNAAFMARLAQRLIHWLSTLTPAGRAYEIDTELRPSGRSGLPVVTLTGFAAYQREQAWTWEHQALTRARAVAGDARLRQHFESVRLAVLQQPRDPAKLRSDVLAMREKMIVNLEKRRPGLWDVKQGAGGIIDVEFITQYLLLREIPAYAELARYTDNWRQLDALADCGVIGADQRDALLAAYRAYRSWLHSRALQGQDPLAPEEQFDTQRQHVRSVWEAVLSEEDAGG